VAIICKNLNFEKFSLFIHSKEVVFIPCAYCKSLMPQTAVFCPHCGARRKG
jgi:Zn finger protein HypA/HybF involved in hydrogenase expression